VSELERLIDLVRSASLGRSAAVIGRCIPNTTVDIGEGVIHFRNHCESGLKMIRVDVVWFVDPPPETVERLGRQMTFLSMNPRVIEGTHD
jgi:hypothetical protein